MPALALLTSDPTDGATGVTTEQVVTLTFNQDLRTSSVTSAVVQLFRDDADFPLPGGLAAAGSKITFIPDSSLHEDALYRIKVIGSDLGLTFALQASDGTFLADTLELTFRTGQELFVPLEKVAARDDIEQIGPIREQDPLFATPTAVVLGALAIEDRTPAPFAKAGIDATAISIDFDRAIAPATVDDTTVVVTQTPVLGIEEYWANIPTGDTTPKLAIQQGVDLTPPTGVLSVVGDVVQWTASGPLLHNTEVKVTVTTDVQGTDGATLPSDVSWIFTTEYVPLYISPTWLRIELGPAIASLSDDTLCRLIHKCSLEAWEESGRSLPLTKPPIRVRQWVECKVVLDILAVLRATADLGAGEQKTLGDLTIRRAPADPMLNMKYRQATECLEKISINLDPAAYAAVAVKGIASGQERLDFRMRDWNHLMLSHVPGGNLTHERHIKSWLGTSYALAGKAAHIQHSFFAITVNVPHFEHIHAHL